MDKIIEKEFTHLKIHTQYSICEGALRTSDLAKFCKDNNFEILEHSITDNNQKINLLTKMMPNLFGKIATFRIK
jgi:DNA polymerase III alpha subunit